MAASSGGCYYRWFLVLLRFCQDFMSGIFLPMIFIQVDIDQWPNKSPEPTPVGAGRSASRLTVFGPAWLSFFR